MTDQTRPRIQPRLLYLIIAATLFAVAHFAIEHGTRNSVYLSWVAFDQNPWLDGWCRWDAMWYRSIAKDGYWFAPGEQSSVAFFPLYPLLMSALSSLLSLRSLRVAVLITLAAGAMSTVLFEKWCAQQGLADKQRSAALLALLLYPFAFFLYGAAYSDALYLSLALGAFVLLENDRPHWAGLVAAFATATRPVGIALIVGLVVRMLERREALPLAGMGFALKKLRRKDYGVLISAVGLASYCAYLWATFNAPTAFAQSQAGWGQEPGLRTWLKAELFDLFFNKPFDKFHLIIGLHAICTVGALALLPRIKRRFGWGYAVYVAIAVALPAFSSKDFMGLGRYLLAAFPVFAVLGEALVRLPRARWLIHGGSAVAMAWLTAMFALWEYVS